MYRKLVFNNLKLDQWPPGTDFFNGACPVTVQCTTAQPIYYPFEFNTIHLYIDVICIIKIISSCLFQNVNGRNLSIFYLLSVFYLVVTFFKFLLYTIKNMHPLINPDFDYVHNSALITTEAFKHFCAICFFFFKDKDKGFLVILQLTLCQNIK